MSITETRLDELLVEVHRAYQAQGEARADLRVAEALGKGETAINEASLLVVRRARQRAQAVEGLRAAVLSDADAGEPTEDAA